MEVWVSYLVKSAFDEDFLRSLPRPHIVIASGFYDWIVDDAPVKKSIGQVYALLPQGGKFILAGQAKHPDRELVNKAFADFNQVPLQMKMRSQETMKIWLEEAGFTGENTQTDPKGYYYTIKGIKE